MGKFSLLFVLCVIFASCTKKKQELPEVPANHPIGSVTTQDINHNKMTKDENGAMFDKPKVTPMVAMKLQELRNKQNTYTKAALNQDHAKKLYLAHCTRCHGPDGEGNGPEANNLPIAPTNLKQWQLKFGSNLEDLVYTITYGRSDNEMPSFRTTIPEADVWTLARLIETWIRPNNPK